MQRVIMSGNLFFKDYYRFYISCINSISTYIHTPVYTYDSCVKCIVISENIDYVNWILKERIIRET